MDNSIQARFIAPSKMDVSFRLAEGRDFGDVVKLSDGVYNGYDHLPFKFHTWLEMENVAIILAHTGEKLVGLVAGFVVDEGKTVVHRGSRILPELRDQGLFRELSQALDQHVRANFPKVCLQRLTSFADLSSKSVNPYKRILEKHPQYYFVKERGSRQSPLLESESDVQIESCTIKYFSEVILCPSMIKRLCPNNVLLFDFAPFEPLRSNVDLILTEGDLHLFVDKCSFDQWPRSFSHGICSRRVKAVVWQATVYTDDPEHFKAHLLHQFQLACELIQGEFTFFAFQDKSMTAVAKELLGNKLRLKDLDLFGNQPLKLYQRDFN